MKDEIILQKLHRVNIAFAVSEKIVSPERLEKGKKRTNKHMFGLHNHLLTQFSVIVSLKHHFLDWSLMEEKRYKENI